MVGSEIRVKSPFRKEGVVEYVLSMELEGKGGTKEVVDRMTLSMEVGCACD